VEAGEEERDEMKDEKKVKKGPWGNRTSSFRDVHPDELPLFYRVIHLSVPDST
jgi:hypothetical protein